MRRSIFRSHLLLLFLLVVTIACSSIGTHETEVNPVERKFIDAGLVDLASVDSTIKVKLVNSNSGDNIFGEDFYQGLEKAYLHKSVAVKLKRAQKILQKKHPGFSLLIMDAARPNSVSAQMYKVDPMSRTKIRRV